MKCNLCNYEGEFLPMGARKNARCPNCRSLERHRAFAESFALEGSIIHVSPNAGIRAYLANKHKEYVISLFESGGWDLANAPNDKQYDNIICIHVLEHIEDDLDALRNIHESLNENGILWLQVPFEKELNVNEGHKTKFTKQGLRAKLTRTGFKGEEINNFFKCTKITG